MAKIKILTTPNIAKDVMDLEPLNIDDMNVKWHNHLENILQDF